jgi:hypothetical protein
MDFLSGVLFLKGFKSICRVLKAFWFFMSSDKPIPKNKSSIHEQGTTDILNLKQGN